MLYSPILSFFRLLVLVPWIFITVVFHTISMFVSQKFFFIFYKFLFFGLTKIFGIKLISLEIKKKKVLFISNHISYLDIIILGSAIDAIFVAKSEIKNWPIINKLCFLGKTIFVERENLKSIKKCKQKILKTI